MPSEGVPSVEEGKPSKKKSSPAVVLLGIFTALISMTCIILGALYGLEIEKQGNEVVVVDTTTTSKPLDSTASGDMENKICYTRECITAASRILNAMNSEADPCEDFFEYACGTWNRDHIIPSDKSRLTTFDDLRDDVSKVLKRVLEKPIVDERESAVKAKLFYKTCMNTDTIDNLGIVPVHDLINEMGGWPVIDGTFTSNETLEEMLARFRSLYVTHGIISSSIGADALNSTTHIFELDQPSLGMPNRDYYIEDSLRSKTEPGYRQFMTDFMKMVAGNGANTNRIAIVVDEIINFETDLAQEMAPQSDRRDILSIYHKMSLYNLSQTAQNFDWMSYLNAVMSVTDDASLIVAMTEEVGIYSLEYLKTVTKIINNRLELVQNYLVWRVLKDRTAYMSSKLRETRAPYTQAISGTTSEESRWLTCSDTSNDYFPMPVGALFVEEAFAEENKRATEIMVEDLRAVFKDNLNDTYWMDLWTRYAASSKADKITPIIAYPDYILEPTNERLDEEYKEATVSEGKYFKTIQNLIIFESKKHFGLLREPVSFEKWLTSPATVNAFYSSSRNQIVFPAGILQPPFYDAGQPASMNYGSIGMVIGHEITHGFDDSGSQFDGDGNLVDWWTNSSRQNFNNLSKCMVDQYSEISWDVADGENINGNLTLGENIADNGGLRQAFGAYKRWQANNPKGDLRLPGLANFTSEQLFFIGNAQIWCSTYTKEYAIRLLKTDSHSPGRFRTLIPNQNFPEFGKAFNCKKGSNSMYPHDDKVCRVW